MLNIKELEDLRTKEELINYFKAMGKNITEEEIEALKQSYNDTNLNKLTMQQLDEIAGGYAQLAVIKRGETSHLTQVNRWVGNKEDSGHTILHYDTNTLKGKIGTTFGLGFLAEKIDINHTKELKVLMENEKNNLQSKDPNDVNIKSIEAKYNKQIFEEGLKFHKLSKNTENFDEFFNANKISEYTNVYNLFKETRDDKSPGYQDTSKALLGLSETPNVVHAIKAHLEHPGEIFEQQAHTSFNNIISHNGEDIQKLIKTIPGKQPNLEQPEQIDLKHYKNNFCEIIELTKGEQRQILVKDKSSHDLHLFKF